MGSSSLLVDILASLYTFPPMDPLLASLYGGVLLGLSLDLLGIARLKLMNYVPAMFLPIVLCRLL